MTSMYEDRFVPAQHLRQAILDVERINSRMIRFTSESNPTTREEDKMSLTILEDALTNDLQLYSQKSPAHENRTELAQIQDSYATYQTSKNKIFELIKSGKVDQAKAIYNVELIVSLQTINGILSRLAKNDSDKAANAAEEGYTISEASRNILLGGLAGAIILGCLVGFFVSQTITRSMRAEKRALGLGLILCKEMVEKNGGQIWVESELGKGTVVKFTVPWVDFGLSILDFGLGEQANPTEQIQNPKSKIQNPKSSGSAVRGNDYFA